MTPRRTRDETRRRTTLGLAASAAIPLLWAAIRRHGWSHSELARQLDIDRPMVAKLLYGDRRAGRDLSVKCLSRLGIPIEAWSQPIARGWKPPHATSSRAAATA